ncbi:MAG: DUF2344 domain-containing protein [Phycisphaerales bacterium]|nr:DUF2344 domain-containing protein [Phycisphaerales bacterium]
MTTQRVAVGFAVEGDLRFLAHQEMLRLFARACARAELPVRASRGFNPKPRISIPLPRPVGITSADERLIIELDRPMDPGDVARRLAGQMPADIVVHGAHVLPAGDRSLPDRVRYRVMMNGFDGERVRAHAANALRAEPIWYDRFIHKLQKTRRIDLRPYIDAIDVTDDAVAFSLVVTGEGSARPAEICDILGLGGQNVNHLIRRVETTWQFHSTNHS